MQERRVVVVGYDGIELVDVASVTSCLAMANRLGASPAYAVRFATLCGGAVRCDSGLELSSQVALQDVSRTHTFVVSGGLGHAVAAADRGLLAQVQRPARSASRVASAGAPACSNAGGAVTQASGAFDCP
ncbi:hypothetical protein [Micromonospora sp. NPDC047740]|uniref:hypothetical protein n=1 Tax=Micromonospora sp. NPDC047740 TaxID=3364254 RepID=UPI00372389FE